MRRVTIRDTCVFETPPSLCEVRIQDCGQVDMMRLGPNPFMRNAENGKFWRKSQQLCLLLCDSPWPALGRMSLGLASFMTSGARACHRGGNDTASPMSRVFLAC